MRCAKSLQMGCSPSDHVGWLFALSAMSVALSACSSTPPTSSNGAGGAAGRAAVATSGSANTTSSAGQTSNNAHGGGLNLSAAGSDPGSIVDPNDACGIGTAEASLKPVTLLIMFDRSSSMAHPDTIDPQTGLNRWQTASAALKGFLSDPSTDGLSVALRFFPHDLPVAGCMSKVCDVAACEQPLVDVGKLSAAPAPADAQEQALISAIDSATPTSPMPGGTPTGAALNGAVTWAKARQAAHPEEHTTILLVTDGQPEGCEERVQYLNGYLSDALSAGIKTYFIGLTDAQGTNLHQESMDNFALSGGTERAYFIKDGPSAATDLAGTLSAVRGKAIACDFPLPEATTSQQHIDPSLVNVTYTSGAGTDTDFTKVLDPANCDSSSSWYYDDEAKPTRISLCPSACALVSSDPKAEFRILVGCASVVK